MNFVPGRHCGPRPPRNSRAAFRRSIPGSHSIACRPLDGPSDDSAVESEVLKWLVISAWKTKSAEPTVLLLNQVKLIREDDARQLGKFVLEAWLAEDLRPPTGEEVKRRLKNIFSLEGGQDR